MSDHEGLKSDIPAYVASRLEGERRRQLEEHLPGCGECSERVSTLRGFTSVLREGGEEMFAPHPDVLALRAYARGERAADSSRIARHVASCATCELELSAWKFRDLMEQTQPAALRESAPRTRPVRSGFGLFPAMSLAAGVVVGVGVSILFHLGAAPGVPAPGSAGELVQVAANWSGPAQLFILSSQVRGEEAVATWKLAADQPYVLLAVRPPVPDSAGADDPYRFEIRGASGQAVWSSDLSAALIRQQLESSEVITFPIPAATLAPGRHEFRFVSLRPADGQPPLEIPFEIVRQ